MIYEERVVPVEGKAVLNLKPWCYMYSAEVLKMLKYG